MKLTVNRNLLLYKDNGEKYVYAILTEVDFTTAFEYYKNSLLKLDCPLQKSYTIKRIKNSKIRLHFS